MSVLRSSRRLALLVALVVLVAGLLVGAYAVWSRGSEFQRAVGLLPPETLRVSWTHWAGLREELGVTDVSGEAGAAFRQEVADRDLAASSLGGSTELLVEGLGLNPLASRWELLGQGPSGMVMVLALDEDTDVEALAGRFGDLGFDEPDEDPLSGGVWRGGPDVITNVPGLATFELQNAAFLADEHLLVGSDDADYLDSALASVTGEEDGLAADDLTGRVPTPLAALGLLEDRACEELSLSSAADDAQALGERLVEEVGGVTPLAGYLVSLEPDEQISLVFGYEDEGRAERDLDARAALAEAEDPAQFVAYPELFTLTDAEQEGATVVLRGTTQPDLAPLSHLSEGPVLLASC